MRLVPTHSTFPIKTDYIFTSLWMILFCASIIQREDMFSLIWGWPGIVPAPGVLTGVFEELGFKPAAVINATSYLLWSAWLIAFGISLLLR